MAPAPVDPFADLAALAPQHRARIAELLKRKATRDAAAALLREIGTAALELGLAAGREFLVGAATAAIMNEVNRGR